ncbi:MAG TPA: hypothetical protein VLA89_13980 [Gemmatimonadales bacterium]|nr:hypothetical protein [Gemmatimonadales bacterium]
MPIRFTSPSLGGQRQVFLQRHEWELGVSYRRLTADDWFIEDQIEPDSAPGGQPNQFNINTIDLSLRYGVTEQLSLLFTVPLTTGTNSRIHPDGNRHGTSATGIGDISLVGNLWLLNASTHPAGNVALGLGIKAPTGKNDIEDDFATPSGTIQHAVHPGIQPGDGGWGILVQAQGYQRLVGDLSGYFFGAYMLNPAEKSEISFIPGGTTPISIPDVYHFRFGAAYPVWRSAGLSTSLGVRFDGIPVRDVLGGDEGFRAPGYTAYIDPGLSISVGASTFTLSVPVRVHGEFKKNVNDQRGGPPPFGNRGDLAGYLVFAGYALRF